MGRRPCCHRCGAVAVQSRCSRGVVWGAHMPVAVQLRCSSGAVVVQSRCSLWGGCVEQRAPVLGACGCSGTHDLRHPLTLVPPRGISHRGASPKGRPQGSILGCSARTTPPSRGKELSTGRVRPYGRRRASTLRGSWPRAPP